MAVKFAVIVLLPVIVPDVFDHELKEYPELAVAVTVVPFIVTLFPDTVIELPDGTSDMDVGDTLPLEDESGANVTT